MQQNNYLTLSKIHSALAYYWEHKKEIDGDIERREQYAQRLQQEAERINR
ncbi:hypothetical protein [Iningainema tapete]|nr:hypothetical protein [Iningainema tapete]